MIGIVFYSKVLIESFNTHIRSYFYPLNHRQLPQPKIKLFAFLKLRKTLALFMNLNTIKYTGKCI